MTTSERWEVVFLKELRQRLGRKRHSLLALATSVEPREEFQRDLGLPVNNVGENQKETILSLIFCSASTLRAQSVPKRCFT